MFFLNSHKKKPLSDNMHSVALEKLVSKIVDSILHQLKNDRHFKKKLIALIVQEALITKKEKNSEKLTKRRIAKSQ